MKRIIDTDYGRNLMSQFGVNGTYIQHGTPPQIFSKDFTQATPTPHQILEEKYICNNTINLFSFRNTIISISGSESGDDEFKIR